MTPRNHTQTGARGNMVDLLRMLCVCGDESNVMDDIHSTSFEEVSLYEETNGNEKVQKKLPAPISVWSYPLDESSSDADEEEEDDYIVYFNEDKIDDCCSVTTSSPSRRRPQQHQLHKNQSSPAHKRTHSSATVTTASMGSLFDDIDDDSSGEFDVSSTLSTEIIRNTMAGSYLPSANSIFRECTSQFNNDNRNFHNNDSSSLSSLLSVEVDAKPRAKLIRMTHENYVHYNCMTAGTKGVTESRYPPTSGERDGVRLINIPRQLDCHHFTTESH